MELCRTPSTLPLQGQCGFSFPAFKGTWRRQPRLEIPAFLQAWLGVPSFPWQGSWGCGGGSGQTRWPFDIYRVAFQSCEVSLLRQGLPYRAAAVPQQGVRNVAHNGPVLAPIKLCFLCPPQRGSEREGLALAPLTLPQSHLSLQQLWVELREWGGETQCGAFSCCPLPHVLVLQ